MFNKFIKKLHSLSIIHFQLSIVLIITMIMISTSYSQTCYSDMEKSTPDLRFTDNGNGTITDIQTGLMWKKCSEGQNNDSTCSGTAKTYTWQQALNQAKTVRETTFAGFNDWRLPNIKELTSIVEESCYSPAINLSFFPNTISSYSWSSSSSAFDNDFAWIVYFYNGDVNYGSYKTNTNYVRLVRAGQ